MTETRVVSSRRSSWMGVRTVHPRIRMRGTLTVGGREKFDGRRGTGKTGALRPTVTSRTRPK